MYAGIRSVQEFEVNWEEMAMYFMNLMKAKEKEITPGVTIRTAWGDKVMLSLVRFIPGSNVPNHSHPHEQAGVILEGKSDFTIGNETKQLKSRDTYIIPGGVEHSVKADQNCVCLDIFHPIREEYK